MLATELAVTKEAPVEIHERRRKTGMALQYWDALRGSRDCPSWDDIDSSLPSEIEPHLFAVTPPEWDLPSRFAAGGSVLASLCGENPIGRPVYDSLPELFRERAAALIAAAFALRKPLADSGRFPESGTTDIVYRVVYMPVTDLQGRFERLLGAISFKRAAAA